MLIDDILAVAATFGVLAAVWAGVVNGTKELSLLGVPLLVVVVGLVFACLGGATACALMYAGGGRMSDAELVAIGDAIAAELNQPARNPEIKLASSLSA